MVPVVIALLLAVVALVVAVWRARHAAPADAQGAVRLPPVVRGALPFLGHSLYLKIDPHRFIRACIDAYGPVFRVLVSGSEFVVVADAELVRELFRHDASLTSADALVKLMGAQHTLGNERPFHPYHGTACKMQLNNRLSTFTPVLALAVADEARRLLPRDECTVMDVVGFAENIIAACGARAFFGERIGDLPEMRRTFRELYAEMDAVTMIYALLGDWAARLMARRFPRHVALLERVLVPEIRERVRQHGHALVTAVQHANDDATGRPHDFLQFLIDTPDDDTGAPLREEVIVNTIGWAILGSMSTTRNGLLHLLYDIACHPDVQARLHQEQRAVMAAHGPELTHAALTSVPYMEMVMRESFRLSFATSLGAFRYTVDDALTLSTGVTIPKHALCTISPYAVHMDPRLFPDSDVFRPERYAEKGAHLMSQGWANKYMLAFGGGVHACPGRFFATHEIKCIVSHLVRAFELRLPKGRTARIEYTLGSPFEIFPAREATPLVFVRRAGPQ